MSLKDRMGGGVLSDIHPVLEQLCSHIWKGPQICLPQSSALSVSGTPVRVEKKGKQATSCISDPPCHRQSLAWGGGRGCPWA